MENSHKIAILCKRKILLVKEAIITEDGFSYVSMAAL